MKKIAVVTGTRAEYGLLSGLMHEIKEDPELKLQVIATGAHLSPEFGFTYQIIEADGFKIDSKIEILLSSDSAIGVGKSIGLAVISFVDAFAQLMPDMVVLLGDRFESLAVAQAALVLKIPLAHIHGGELSEGAIDDAIRHSITKMSHLHFVAAEPYRKRVMQLGESPKNIFNVGAPGLERISKMQLLSRQDWEKSVGYNLGKMNFLVTYLPATLDMNDNAKTLAALFEALDHFRDANIIFTKANADEAGRFVNSEIDKYVTRNIHRATAFTNLGDLKYLSLLPFVEMVIGNSSSGLIEVPYFKKPTINIGNRQNNRLRSDSVIDCDGNVDAIIEAMNKGLSIDFQKNLKNVKSAYGLDTTAKKIKDVMKAVDLKSILFKKFNDI